MTDYDSDNDGLIEITNATQFNAIRHDVDGNGDSTHTDYLAAFPEPFPGLGCRPVSGTPTCTGYEIGADSSAAAVNIDLNVAPHNANKGWAPITGFAAIFEGNRNTISGLFGSVTSTSKIRNVGLPGVKVTGGNNTGALVGINSGSITASYAGGSVQGRNYTGGLVGTSSGSIIASYYRGAVGGTTRVGGLAGYTSIGTIVASYATGAVSGNHSLGGLVGEMISPTTITASYSTGLVTGSTNTNIGGLVGFTLGTVTDSYWDTETSGQATSGGGTGKTTSELQTPTAYGTGIYANWNLDLDLDGDSINDDPWNFGAATQYPRLKFGGLNPLTQHVTDYDSDNDGLIEITNATQLNAIRHDVDGNGDSTHTDYLCSRPRCGCAPLCAAAAWRRWSPARSAALQVP